ncbi:hypothetical protein PPERSA_07047 [Pseudocohnilembus persalinus]|uniref:Uncharacterized protein n=1 Tax=Pseudocohnilembus persalinus TaxID=266149 RepID=A0A0V0QAT6_PSEPJ|nr:hypothetical protein PPERSA_07047 [Pseudocohnilembus persalinus]|eukprot:KRW99275.1 hypothetical protein PPERSA_07047 [Pseudocohnilembus persalinus]
MNEIKKSQIEENIQQQQKNFTPYFNKYEQANRISDSFPPTTNQNQHYYASGHKILDQIDKQKITQNDFIFKQFAQKEQINEIKMLHREWFPIQYPDNFFNQIFERQVNLILVEMKLEKFMNNKKYSENDENYNENDDYFNNKLLIDFEYDREYEQYVKKNKTIVVGMLIWNNR